MKAKFTEGQRVGCAVDEASELTGKRRYHGEYDEGPAFGKVVEVLPNGKVKVLWDEEFHNEHSNVYNKTTGKLVSSVVVPRAVNAAWLLPEEEMKKVYVTLEKEYEAVAKQVRAKLKEAGSLIKEANKLAKKAGAESLNDMYDVLAPLEDAMDSCGWRTSSWNC